MPAQQFQLNQLLRRHYVGVWRMWVIGVLVGAMGMMAYSDRKEDKEFDKNRVPAMDIKFIYRQLDFFLKSEK